MDKVEYYFENYRKEKEKLYDMEHFLENYKPISENAIIQSLVFEKNEGERVKTSLGKGRSEMLALNFREKMEAENREYFDSNLQKYLSLKADLDFFEQSVSRLDKEYQGLVKDLVFNGLTWDEVIYKHKMSRSTIGRKRKLAIEAIRGHFSLMGKSLML
ncbi:TPA: hypothetical protein ACHVGM_000997 [Streptococcus suis]